MKKLFLTISVIFLFASITEAAVSIRYSNSDSKTYTMDVSIGGSTTTVEFGGSRTASVTIQGGSETCIIETTCGKVTVKDGDTIEIKNGCISIK